MRKSIVGSLFLSLAAAACGGTATMDFKLMDAPPAGVTAVKIWVASMQTHVVDKDKSKDKSDPADASIDDAEVVVGKSEEANKWVSLVVNKEIDLVAHQGEAAAQVLGQLELPEGKITQLRLVLDTTKADSNKATFNGADCALDLGKIPQKGIKINHVFKAFDVNSGGKHEVIVDFDLTDAMKTKGSCFELEPKLKLHKVKTEGADVSTTP